MFSLETLPKEYVFVVSLTVLKTGRLSESNRTHSVNASVNAIGEGFGLNRDSIRRQTGEVRPLNRGVITIT